MDCPSDEEIHVRIGEKPNIYQMERSPLLQKAALFKEMLAKDNENLKRLMEEPGRREMFDIECFDPDKTYVQMEILPGVLEARQHEFAPPDPMVLPPKGSSCWNAAGIEK